MTGCSIQIHIVLSRTNILIGNFGNSDFYIKFIIYAFIMKTIKGDDVTMLFTFVLFIVSDHIVVIAVQTYQDQIGNLTIMCMKCI